MKPLFSRSLISIAFLLTLLGCQPVSGVMDSADLLAAKESLSPVYRSGDSAASVTGDLGLPTAVSGGIEVSWASDHPAVSPAGRVTRPASGSPDLTVRLTASLKKGNAAETKRFTLLVRALASAFAVTFDSRGGSAVPGVSVGSGTLVPAPAAPTRLGMTFTGWFQDEACTRPWAWGTGTVTGPLTLFAGWGPGPSVQVSVDFRYGEDGPGGWSNVYAVWMENTDLSFVQNLAVCRKLWYVEGSHQGTGGLTGVALPYWKVNRYPRFSPAQLDAVTGPTVAKADVSVSAPIQDPTVRRFTVYWEGDRSFEPNDWFSDQPALLYAAEVDLDSGASSFPMVPVGWTPNDQTQTSGLTLATGTLSPQMGYVTAKKNPDGSFGAADPLGATRMVRSLTVTVR